MANVFIDLPVPAANGVGAAQDVSTLGRVKTITVQGTLVGTVTIEFSQDNVDYFPLKSFSNQGKITVALAARWMRARVSGYIQGAANADVGSTDFGTTVVSLPVPAGDGTGAPVDVSLLGTFNTATVAGNFSGTLTIEISEDGVDYADCMGFTNPGYESKDVVAQFMRVNRAGALLGAPGTATVNVCATNDAAGAAPPIGPAGGDLSGTYPNPSVAALTETGGPTSLPFGAVADGQVLRRVGGNVVGVTPPLGYSPPEKWHQENVAAGQSNVDLSAMMSVSFDTIKAIRVGNIVGLSTRFSQAITDANAGSAVVTVTVNGVAGTLAISHSSGANPSGGEATQAAGIDTFVTGDELGIEITTLGTFAPTTSDVEAWMDLEF